MTGRINIYYRLETGAHTLFFKYERDEREIGRERESEREREREREIERERESRGKEDKTMH